MTRRSRSASRRPSSWRSEEVDFEPTYTQVRFIRQGINRAPFWFVSLSIPIGDPDEPGRVQGVRRGQGGRAGGTPRWSKREKTRRRPTARRTSRPRRSRSRGSGPDAPARPPAHLLRAPRRLHRGDRGDAVWRRSRSRSTRASRCRTGASSTPCWPWAARWPPMRTRPHPWLAPEKGLLREAAEDGRPILGVCLGVQLLASALGAEVTAMRARRGRPAAGRADRGGAGRPAVRRHARAAGDAAVARRHLRAAGREPSSSRAHRRPPTRRSGPARRPTASSSTSR